MKKIYLMIVTLFLVVFLAACGNTSSTPEKTQTNEMEQPSQTEEQEQVELTISAAASLTDVLEVIKQKYAEEHPNVTINVNLGPSGQLQQQIEQGAPADVFISAAQKQMNALEEKDLIVPETRVDILSNELVLIAPTNSTTINSFEDLKDPAVKHIGIGNPESVPAGEYAQEVLQNMNLWDVLSSKLVEGQNVRAVLSFVETGNAEAGFVYSSDTVVSDKVKIIAAAPEGSASPIVYPAAVVKGTKQVDAAKDFVQFLQADTAIETFEQFGFKKVVK